MHHVFKTILLISLLLTLSIPVYSMASDKQFYFVARQAPSGSITQEGQSQQVVYLRWDVVEGDLPSDVVGLRLLRNNVPLHADFPVNEVMSESSINTLYQGVAQKRRKFETVTRLNELAAAKGDAFSAANFASYLRDLINPANSNTYNAFWAYFASRSDFNIARARYRGWIDSSAGTGLIEYKLLAVNAVGSTATLGITRVQVGVATTLLGATNLRQVLYSDSRCDMPENAKDHFTVALNWNSPGDDGSNSISSDRVAAQFYITGFDLYRSSHNVATSVTTAPTLDIASLASVSPTDKRGNPQLTGLEKINVSLIVDSGTTTDEPKWQETQDLLKRAGLKPGDRRAYYLVPRDFTGNYGPTIATMVEVPLMTRPPAPWNIRSFADETTSAINQNLPDALTLSWDQVNLDNYVRMNQDYQRYCNLLEARQTGLLKFVGKDQSCELDLQSTVRLDVVGYRIYRFTDFDVAGLFKDSDGDGVADTVERVEGFQCNPEKQPAAAKNYLAPDTEIQLITINGLLSTDPQIVRLRDQVPAAQKDTVYWYRVASVAGSLEQPRLSFLSAPQRGLFPDRTPPPEPLVEVLRPGKTPTGCRLISDSSSDIWRFKEQLSPNEKPANFVLNCNGNSTYSITGQDIANASSVRCQAIRSDSNCDQKSELSLSFPASELTGGKVCDVNIPNDISFCDQGDVRMVPNYEDAIVNVQTGDLVPGTVTINVVPPNNKTCVALYETIDGISTRVSSSCSPEGLSYQPGEGMFCGYAVTSDQNNNISAVRYLPCTLATTGSKLPGPPHILSFSVDDTHANFSFRLPLEQIVVTMARIAHDIGDGLIKTDVLAIPTINYQAGQVTSHTIPVDALTKPKDNFCLELKALAANSDSGQPSSSSWSLKRCYTRLESGDEDLPQYMPWPAVESPVKGKSISAKLIKDYRKVPMFLMLELANNVSVNGECEHILPNQIPGQLPDPLKPASETNKFDDLECTDIGVTSVRAALASKLNFILYRQKRVAGGERGKWIQVSPLIEFAHFDDIPSRPRENKNSSSIEWRLNDPFVKFFYDDILNQINFIYLDRYPFTTATDMFAPVPYEFRYQAVYFDSLHKPVRWSQSDWVREEE